MTTRNLDTGLNLDETLAYLVERGERRLAARQAQLEEQAAERTRQERARVRAEWQPRLDLVYASLPTYLHDYLSCPVDEEPYSYRGGDGGGFNAMFLDLPECGRINVYVDMHTEAEEGARVHYLNQVPQLTRDEYGGDEWVVWWRITEYHGRPGIYDIRGMNSDLEIALYEAHVAYQKALELGEQADLRNIAKAQQPQPQPVPVAADPLERIAIALEALVQARLG